MSLVIATSVASAMSIEPGSRSHWSCRPSIVATTTRAAGVGERVRQRPGVDRTVGAICLEDLRFHPGQPLAGEERRCSTARACIGVDRAQPVLRHVRPTIPCVRLQCPTTQGSGRDAWRQTLMTRLPPSRCGQAVRSRPVRCRPSRRQLHHGTATRGRLRAHRSRDASDRVRSTPQDRSQP
jgi:hypothetical protein